MVAEEMASRDANIRRIRQRQAAQSEETFSGALRRAMRPPAARRVSWPRKSALTLDCSRISEPVRPLSQATLSIGWRPHSDSTSSSPIALGMVCSR